MKKKIFTGQPGQSSEILTQKLLKKPLSKEKIERKTLKDTFQGGAYQNQDLSDIYLGYSVLEEMLTHGLEITKSSVLTGEKDVSRTKMDLVAYKDFIEMCLRRIDRYIRKENNLRLHLIELREHYQYAQAARDGVLLKQDTRMEKDPITGEMREITFDISMTPNEVIKMLEDYEDIAIKLKFNKISNYIGLGTSFIGILGIFSKLKDKEKDSDAQKSFPIISVGSLVVSSLKLAQRFVPDKDHDEAKRISRAEKNLTYEFLDNEQISNKAEDDVIEEIASYARRKNKLESKADNKGFLLDSGLSVIIALIMGIYIKSKLPTKENNKFDGKALATTLIDIQETGSFISYATRVIERIINDKEERRSFIELAKEVEKIEAQMQEKVYPLKGATHPFDSFSIHDLDGKFYPTTDYTTGKIKYGTKISAPEFSMKRGDVVLISGESGTGKSTFLRFLKRGDINNRCQIELDNGEYVDHLGSEYISFRPSTKLGDETTVLNQITGKTSIYELSEEERKHLLKIMKELKLQKEGILEELAQKKFMQFSTGQQRRLALSKVFYRINDGTSVVIVDEPVGNVEDSLIREQLEMIKQYAQDENLMLILVTHRIDLAEDLVNKRYHISNDGKMEEILMKSKEIDR